MEYILIILTLLFSFTIISCTEKDEYDPTIGSTTATDTIATDNTTTDNTTTDNTTTDNTTTDNTTTDNTTTDTTATDTTPTWTKQIGTSSVDRAYGVATDSSDNVYVTGYTNARIFDGNTNAGADYGGLIGYNGGPEPLLIKYNTSGTKQWSRLLGSSLHDIAYGVATDSSGNVYVTGVTYGSMDGFTNAGGSDIFVIKYNSSGTKQWTRLLGTSGYGNRITDIAYGVATDSSDNVYVTGYTEGGLDGNSSAGSRDLFVVKYNSSGTKQWTKQLGTSYDDEARGIATDSSGNIYVTGYTNGGLDGSTSTGGRSLFVVKYGWRGNIDWRKQLGTDIEYNSSSSVAIDSSGNVYVTGKTYTHVSHIIVVKYNTSGTMQWTKVIKAKRAKKNDPYSEQSFGNGVAIDSSGNVYVTGNTNGGLDDYINAGLDGYSNEDDGDIFVIKYNSSGTKQWTKQLGTSSDDDARGIATDSSGNIYVTGSTNAELNGNTSAGDSDIFVMKYNAQ